MAEQDDELLRWAAEDVLNLHPGWMLIEQTRQRVWWRNPQPSALSERPLTEADLLGWPGFGLAVEAAKAAGTQIRFATEWNPSARFGPKERPEPLSQEAFTGKYRVAALRYWTGPWMAEDSNPALAAWAALREALAARE